MTTKFCRNFNGIQKEVSLQALHKSIRNKPCHLIVIILLASLACILNEILPKLNHSYSYHIKSRRSIKNPLNWLDFIYLFQWCVCEWYKIIFEKTLQYHPIQRSLCTSCYSYLLVLLRNSLRVETVMAIINVKTSFSMV